MCDGKQDREKHLTSDEEYCTFPLKSERLKTDYRVSWNGDDNSGKTLPSGIYFCRMRHNDEYTGSKKILLLRRAED